MLNTRTSVNLSGQSNSEEGKLLAQFSANISLNNKTISITETYMNCNKEEQAQADKDYTEFKTIVNEKAANE